MTRPARRPLHSRVCVQAPPGRTKTNERPHRVQDHPSEEARPDVRVILLAVGREPGDPQVARIVASRVDDVVTDLERVPVALLKPASYHDTLSWLAPHVANSEAHPAKTVENVIIRKVASTTQPVIIVVNSYAPAAGCTTCAVAVAAHLSERNYEVALVETVKDATGGVLSLFMTGPTPLAGAKWQPGLRAWTIEDAADIRNIIAERESEYIVIDDGMQFTHLVQDIVDLKIIAVPDCSWRLPDLLRRRRKQISARDPSHARSPSPLVSLGTAACRVLEMAFAFLLSVLPWALLFVVAWVVLDPSGRAWLADLVVTVMTKLGPS